MPGYLPRHLVGSARRALATFPAVLVTGARQSGKTTLLRTEFGARFAYISLERPDVRARALADPLGFLAEHAAPLILDEIQYAPELLHYLKDQIDRDRRPGQWLLSGSQSFPLMRGVSQTLAGRVAVLTLDPLSVTEVVRHPAPPDVDGLLQRVWGEATPGVRLANRPDLGDWLLRGGFPEICLTQAVDRQLWFGSYVQTYLERDVRDLLQVGDLGAFGRFVALVAARTGTLLNMTDLARDAGVTAPTVKRWLSVLEASQVVYLLRPFHSNLGKRITKSPKVYLMDPALAGFLMGLQSREALLGGPTAGALVETAVVTEWVKAFRQSGELPSLFHWRSTGGLEVDLIVERHGHLYAMEVKATATPAPPHAEALARWLALAGPRARGVLACRIEVPTPLRPGIRAVPWHLAW